MLSSHNFIKQSDMIEEQESRKIETNYTVKKKPSVFLDEEGQPLTDEEIKEDLVLSAYQKEKMSQFNQDVLEARHHLKKVFKKERDKFFHELLEIKELVTQQAHLEGEEIKKEAYQAGLKEGQKDGYESGLETGYEAGVKQANTLKENALFVVEKANLEMATYQKEKQQDFVDLAVEMAEIILNQELTLSEEALKVLLEPVLNRIEKTDNFITVFVSKMNMESTQCYMRKLKEENPEMKYTVISDESLNQNDCIVETNYELLDLTLRKQLEKMVEKLKLGDSND